MKLAQAKGLTTRMWKIITVISIMKHWTLLYFASLTALINPVMSCTKDLESLLVSAANGQVCDQCFDNVTTFYKDDFDRPLLSAQLQNFGTSFAEKTEKTETISLGECMTFLRSLSLAHKSFFSEVCRLANLILVMPATNAVSTQFFFHEASEELLS